ncbi:FdtA/QdtA family cupin domain-containing protein [Hymenobacter sp. BT559]|jgi:mannose-6-phosphate isomerase-like protein (cupin superfamily)|uniref:sugar 3,4-ketoisomerase n=1 Tax=Hymenobacter sp. BT559 TaxID=2795729 RepID=UPI0018EB2254|nr:FdtA/QdtA family cupin domain-containing protein [Hymenobacter sp. BT559]MBJ6141832.1 FdtA/QdtA family cupin domain-containing protein [Hymenobacter sp. BT559]
MQNPYQLEFPKLGQSNIGYISVTEHTKHVPFEVQRIFWTYYTPESIVRGRHAHHRTEQVLVAVAGRIIVTTELADGTIQTFRLEDPHVGVYIPPHAWHTMQYSHSAVQLVLASSPYDEADYIRSYDDFKQIWQHR